MDEAIVEHGQLQESYLRNNSEKHRFANYTSSKTTLSSSVTTTEQQHRNLTSSVHNSSRTMRLTIAGSWLWLVVLSVSVYVVGAEDNRPWVRPAPVGATPTPAPELNFSAQPANTSVVEGSIAIMKCKAVRPVHHCSWYYIETNRSFYDEGAEPKLVKQFTPSKDNDCSIRFTKVRKVQEGQWLCQTRRYMGTTLYNTRPAYLQVITDTDERDYEERSGGSGDSLTPMSSGDDDPITTRDPTAPTAIPALGPPPSSGPLPFPPHGPLNPKVPPALPGPDPTQELPPSEDSDDNAKHEPEVKHAPRFNYSADDHILNTKTGATATLPCHVNVHVTSCAWVMPNSALFVWNEADNNVFRSFGLSAPTAADEEAPKEYEFVGNRSAGDCSLRVLKVRHHDEGNWRCVVGVRAIQRSPPVHRAFAAAEPSAQVDFQGPLIHLHLLDYHHGSHPDDKPTPRPGVNTTLIVLLMVGLLLFAIGSIVIYCCYKRVQSKRENCSKNIQSPTRNSDSEYQQQWFQGRNLKIADPNYTDDFKLRNATAAAVGANKIANVDAMNLKNAKAVNYSDIDHYNQYLNMRQSDLASARSSASSNTTLSTMVPDPYVQDKSLSFISSPKNPVHNMAGNMIQNPSFAGMNPGNIEGQNVPFYELHRQLQRPVSLYSTSHVYEEIEDKLPQHKKGMPHIIGHDGNVVILQAQPNGQIATTPVYTNVVEDHDGYLIPSKSAKIVNRTTEEDPMRYLPMKGTDHDSRSSLEGNTQRQHNISTNLNNLSLNQNPSAQHQISNDQHGHYNKHQWRKSSDSDLSNDNNYSPEQKQSPPQNPNLDEPASSKRTPHKSTPTTPTGKRQRMPLPATPTEKRGRLGSDAKPPKSSLNAISSSVHQRTTSLPDTTTEGNTKARHSMAPSFVPAPENYDVPRTLDAVARSVNGSEISLDDIDGTIV